MKRFFTAENDISKAVINWNGAASISGGDILFVITDDLFPTKGWDKQLRELLKDLNPKEYHIAIKINYSNSNLLTKMRHTISRKYYEKFELFDNKFRGLLCGYDITSKAFLKSRIIEARKIKIMHNNANEKKSSNNKISISSLNIMRESEYGYGFKIIQDKWSHKRFITNKFPFKQKLKFLNSNIYFPLSNFARFLSLFIILCDLKLVMYRKFIKSNLSNL